ncbi:MAG: hypothetical protein AB1742_15405 [bacterium]
MKRALPLFFAAAFTLLQPPAHAQSPGEVWKNMEKGWNEARDVEGVIAVFIYYPKELQKHFPESKEELEANVGGWKHHKLKYTWKKPGKIHIEFIFGKNLGVDIISKLVENNPGTRLAFGHLDTKNIYARFPPSRSKETLMIDKQIEKKIFYVRAGVEKYSSALLELSFSGTLLDLLRSKRRYFDPARGTVEMTKGKLKWKKNFRVKNDKVLYDEEPAPGEYLVITMNPVDPKKNRMIGREIMYVGADDNVPAQHEVYYNDTIVACMTIEDVKLNTGVSDELWEKFYEGAEIAEQKKH